MRKSSFRAKPIRINPESLWEYGAVSIIGEHTFLVHMEELERYDKTITYVPVCIEVIQETVCECTGVHDSNAMSIWEGDIIEIQNPPKFRNPRGYVYYENGTFKVKFDKYEVPLEEYANGSQPFFFFVVGNIHDNQKLTHYQED